MSTTRITTEHDATINSIIARTADAQHIPGATVTDALREAVRRKLVTSAESAAYTGF
jgi:hypothetical protein